MAQTKHEIPSEFYAEEQHNSENNNSLDKQQQTIHMQHKEIEEEDDLERLHIHADPGSPR